MGEHPGANPHPLRAVRLHRIEHVVKRADLAPGRAHHELDEGVEVEFDQGVERVDELERWRPLEGVGEHDDGVVVAVVEGGAHGSLP